MITLDNEAVSTHLGKTSKYEKVYNPSLLVKEPRQSNRKHLNIDDDKLPFQGYDIWNAYEVSCLLDNGQPVTFVGKIVYPCYNKHIVESKSLKLYLNSFNMTKMGETSRSAKKNMENTISDDLSDLLGTVVNVTLHSSVNTDSSSNYFEDYVNLEDTVNCSSVDFKHYVETPSLLVGVESNETNTYRVHSTLLKSNCRVTGQPDWGDVFIYIKTKYEINLASLLQYIVSFRDECHFHEEITEAIYKRLTDTFKPEELAVTCLYVRRGGIDINPTRVSSSILLTKELIDCDTPFIKTPRQ